jgi:hypothetical protein
LRKLIDAPDGAQVPHWDFTFIRYRRILVFSFAIPAVNFF